VNLIIDENLPPRWFDYLASHGVSAIHWTKIGKPGDPDDFVFTCALESHAIIITQDLDFT
jgi:predicted nuclease of predicted toxin-antitoxin system